MDLHWFLAASPVNYCRHKDTVMDELYQKQSRATDPEERRKYLRAFEKRLYDDEVHYIVTFQWHSSHTSPRCGAGRSRRATS
jgi:ABC-type transport system substrate-binding protein